MIADDLTTDSDLREFQFQYKEDGFVPFPVKTQVCIPADTNIQELCHNIVKENDVPPYMVEELDKELHAFVTKETIKYYDLLGDKVIESAMKSRKDKKKSDWHSKYKSRILKFAGHDQKVTNEEVFSQVYHDLIHSAALNTLLNLEHNYSLDVATLIEQRNSDLENLKKKQNTEMTEAMKKVGKVYSDEYISNLAQKHFENTQVTETKWNSQLSSLQETQRRDYRQWLMSLHEDTQTAEGQTPKDVQTIRSLSNPGYYGDDNAVPLPTHREESFTVHLGAQLKTMHNIRVIATNVIDLCRHNVSQSGISVASHSQRLQTAMSLYSNSLCGMVLLVDQRLNSYAGIKREFANVCEQSTDFHFPSLSEQFEKIAVSVHEAMEHKKQHAGSDSDRASIKSSASSGSVDIDAVRMSPGEFYITRHSNLSQVHVVFHLVTDDSVLMSDLSSRHPVVWGYRNIIKACFKYDIHTITLPLFLTHHMTEEMTIPWCLKRAELIFKCVKGFIMELSTWGDQQSCTVQFLVPKNLSDDAFGQITTMLPTIFRMSNPVTA